MFVSMAEPYDTASKPQRAPHAFQHEPFPSPPTYFRMGAFHGRGHGGYDYSLLS